MHTINNCETGRIENIIHIQEIKSCGNRPTVDLVQTLRL